MSEKEKKATEAKKSAPKKDGPSFWDKVKRFFREYKSEMKKISWPTFKEVVKNSAITLVFVLMVGVVIWLFDWGASSLRNLAIDAAKGDVSNSDLTLSGADLEALISNGDIQIDVDLDGNASDSDN